MEPQVKYQEKTFSPDKEGQTLPVAIAQVREKLDEYFKELIVVEKEEDTTAEN
jgi:hypothetical protein